MIGKILEAGCTPRANGDGAALAGTSACVVNIDRSILEGEIADGINESRVHGVRIGTAFRKIQGAILQIETDAVSKRNDVVEVVSVGARCIRKLQPADKAVR